jgi:hypothetical protein
LHYTRCEDIESGEHPASTGAFLVGDSGGFQFEIDYFVKIDESLTVERKILELVVNNGILNGGMIARRFILQIELFDHIPSYASVVVGSHYGDRQKQASAGDEDSHGDVLLWSETKHRFSKYDKFPNLATEKFVCRDHGPG